MSQREWLAESVLVPRTLIDDAIDALEFQAHWSSRYHDDALAAAAKLSELMGEMPKPSPEEREEGERAVEAWMEEHIYSKVPGGKAAVEARLFETNTPT